MMHPETARALVSQRHEDLARLRYPGRGPRRSGGPPGAGFFRRRFPRWHVSWTRTVLASATQPGIPGGGRRGSSLVIIISAHR